MTALRPVTLLRPAAMLGLVLLVLFGAAACGGAATGPSGQPSRPGQPSQPGASPDLVRVGRVDDSTTASARVGDTIQVALGADLDWTVDLPTPEGILRAWPIPAITGIQAQYTATAPGTVTIVASGRPRCPAYTACIQVIVPFRATVAVR